MRFRTTVLQAGKTATGIQVPDEVVEALAGGKKPKVVVTVNGFSYRSSIASMGGRSMVGVSAATRAAAGVAGGDVVDVASFDTLSYSKQRGLIEPIGAAKSPDTRQRRIDKALARLRAQQV